MLKNWIQILLQKVLGFKQYLFLFAAFSIYRIRFTRYDEEFLHFLSLIPDGGTVLDIGANIGMTTVPLSKKLKASSIAAFEPIPSNVAALKKIIRFFNCRNVTVYPMALGDTNGRIQMIMPVINHVKKQGLSHVVKDQSQVYEGGETFSVPMMRLDEVTELKTERRITAIKIDVEQFEYAVLSGGLHLLNQHRPIIYCELWNTPERKILLDFMQGIGYEVKIFEQGSLKDYHHQDVLNFFFIHKQQHHG